MDEKFDQKIVDDIYSSKRMSLSEKLSAILSYLLQFTKEELEASQGENKKPKK